MNTLAHIESMQATARALEEHARKVGYYSADCDTLDAALKSGASGFVVLFRDGDEDGEPEVHAIGKRNAEVHVKKDKNDPNHWSVNYNPLDEGELARRVARGKSESANTKKGDFKPMQVKGTKAPTADEDRRRAQMSMDAKRERIESIARNEAIAARFKEFWNKKKTA